MLIQDTARATKLMKPLFEGASIMETTKSSGKSSGSSPCCHCCTSSSSRALCNLRFPHTTQPIEMVEKNRSTAGIPNALPRTMHLSRLHRAVEISPSLVNLESMPWHEYEQHDNADTNQDRRQQDHGSPSIHQFADIRLSDP